MKLNQFERCLICAIKTSNEEFVSAYWELLIYQWDDNASKDVITRVKIARMAELCALVDRNTTRKLVDAILSSGYRDRVQVMFDCFTAILHGLKIYDSYPDSVLVDISLNPEVSCVKDFIALARRMSVDIERFLDN